MSSLLISNTYLRVTSLKQLLRHSYCVRNYNTASSEHNVKRIKLLKRLASTFLFGGTFLLALYAKKRKRFAVFDEAKLVNNPNFPTKFKLYEYKGYVLPLFVMKVLDRIKNFPCEEDDIFVVSYPKTGTTWLQEIIYCVINGVETSSKKNIEDKFPYLEFIYPGIDSINKIQEQRFIKTHLPYTLLPDEIHTKSPKILCIMRNPKDVAVSYYHFVRMMTLSDYSGDFKDFLKDFMTDKKYLMDLFGNIMKRCGDKDDSNVLIIFYEDLKADIHGSIKLISRFLSKELTDEEINDIAMHCSFTHMANNPNTNYQHWDDLGIRKRDEAKFMRKGEVGDWKNYFDSEMNESTDLWISNNFKNTSRKFSFNEKSK